MKNLKSFSFLVILFCFLLIITNTANAHTSAFDSKVEQLTSGKKHHFFGTLGSAFSLLTSKGHSFTAVSSYILHQTMSLQSLYS